MKKRWRRQAKEQVQEERKSQSSVEYLFLMGAIFFLLVPSVYLYYNHSRTKDSQEKEAYLSDLGNEIINQARQVQMIGNGAWVTITAQLPENIIGGRILNNTVILDFYTSNGRSEQVFFSDVQLRDANVGGSLKDLKPGINKIKVESKTDYGSKKTFICISVNGGDCVE